MLETRVDVLERVRGLRRLRRAGARGPHRRPRVGGVRITFVERVLVARVVLVARGLKARVVCRSDAGGPRRRPQVDA